MFVGITVSAGSSTLFGSFLRFAVEIAESVFEFILDSLTRGNLDNDILA
jgi:hypothetical protein